MRADIPKYQQLAEQTQRHLEATGHAGDRLISLRDFASRESVSITTALRVYEELELSGVVESRQRSGYFLRDSVVRQVALPTASTEILVARNEKELFNGLNSSAWHAHKFAAYFASGTPDTGLACAREVSRMIRRTARRQLQGRAAAQRRSTRLRHDHIISCAAARQRLVIRSPIACRCHIMSCSVTCAVACDREGVSGSPTTRVSRSGRVAVTPR